MEANPQGGRASRLVFREEGHLYFLDGHEIPGNTTLLKDAGLIDDTWFTPESRDRGKRVHKACHFQDELSLNWDTVRSEEKGYVEAFVDFKLKTGWVSEANEFQVWSAQGYATTPDLLGVLDGRRGLCNLKTGAISKWVALQLAGEFLATTERIQAQEDEWAKRLEYIDGHPWPTARWALQLKANGKWKLHEFDDPGDEAAFLGIVHLHHWRKRNGY